jgi:prophage DNA circulation protein
LGRKTREFQIIGFLLQGDIASDVMAHRDALIFAAEKADTGTLIHPTMGPMEVSLLNVVVTESVEHGRMFRVELTFIEAGKKEFNSSLLISIESVSAPQSFFGAITSFVQRVNAYYRQGLAVVQQAEATCAYWIRQGQTLVDDATNVYNFVTTLPQTIDGMFGRFFGGRTLGGFGTPTLGTRQPLNLQTVLALGTVYRQDAKAAFDGLTTASSGNDTTAIGNASQAVAQAVKQASVNPADAIRLLQELAVFVPPSYSTSAPIGTAINGISAGLGDLFRRCAVIALAEAGEQYQPSSYDDAALIRDAICASLDVEIETAGDQGEDDMFSLLRGLRSSVSISLTNRGATLAPIEVFNSKLSLPAPVWALRIYRDTTRSDELVTQVNPPHPAFMPLTFKALSA